MVSAEPDNGRMPDRIILEYSYLASPASHIYQRHSELLFVGVQHRPAGSERLQNDVLNLKAGPLAAFDDILDCACHSGYDVNLGFQPNPGHPDRMKDAVLVIDNELLGQDVQYLPVERQGDRLCGIQDPGDIRLCDLPALYGDYPVTVHALDVSARNSGKDRRNFTPGHEFGFFDRFSYGIDRLVYIYYDPSPQAC
jgi:hypothetical protein